MLVALALLGIALTLVISLYYREGRVRQRIHEQLAATAFLESQMEKLRMLAPLDEGRSSWDLAAEGEMPAGIPLGKAKFELIVEPWEEEGIQRVELRLAWGPPRDRAWASLEALFPGRASP
jgi:hypothetical protein